ncbi:hypothetical protein [Vulcanococcus limneticus]|uniref:hypothetical protein n=1 Tax=Vulcanococcus limneticus TaxID=2170428 RepID=UPI00398BD799
MKLNHDFHNLLIAACVPLGVMGMAMPSRSAEKVDCGQGAQVEVVNGVIICKTKTEVATKPKCDDDTIIERIPVYYSDPTSLKEVLDKTSVPCTAIIGVNQTPPSLIVKGQSKLKGDIKEFGNEAKDLIDIYKRRIAQLDLPRERVNMDMWAIQISSSDSAHLASVMDQVNREIDHTRRAMYVAYNELTSLSRDIKIQDASVDIIPSGFQRLLTDTDRQRLSLPDVLMRINFACPAPRIGSVVGSSTCASKEGKPRTQTDVYNRAALNLCKVFAGPEHSELFAKFNQFEGREQMHYVTKRILTGDSIPAFRRPFQRFQEVALHQKFPRTSRPVCGEGQIDTKREEDVLNEWKRRQYAINQFLQAYSDTKTNPKGFNPADLQSSASQLDGLLSPITNALNQDIEEYFIRPTIHRIKKIVGRYRNVEYAEVGRTTVIGLNGLLSKVTSTTATTFDEPTPLRLNNLINDAAQVKPGVDKLFPAAQSIPLAAGAPIDASSAISILAALSKEDVRWRAMSSGITLDITPTVFRDRTAALIDVALTIADPAKTNVSHSEQNPLRTPARISQSTLTTKVNVNTMDLFAISSFNNQTTVTGRRWYVPLVGPVWEGVFGDIPVVGNLFSPIRPPINVQHQSIILTNTLIVPTAMGLTEWYQPDQPYQPSINPLGPPSLRSPGQPYRPYY